MVDYQKFFDLLCQQNISQYSLIKRRIISPSSLDAMRKHKYIRSRLIDRLCKSLSCSPDDIFESEADDELLKTISFVKEQEDSSYELY